MLGKSKVSLDNKRKKVELREYYFPPHCPSCGVVDYDYLTYCEVCGYRKWFHEE